MLIQLIINVIISSLAVLFQWLPSVETIPAISGYDIDSALVTGFSAWYGFIGAFWPLLIVWNGVLFLMSYYGIKVVVRFFLGQRAP